MTSCTLTTSPRTIHLVKTELSIVTGGVQTWCGKRGMASAPNPDVWRHCQKCAKAEKVAA